MLSGLRINYVYCYDYRNCWTIPRTGLYSAKGLNRPFLVLEPYKLRIRYLPRSSKYRADTAVANANGVLVRLIWLARVLDILDRV